MSSERERFRKSAEHLPDALLVCDRKGSIVIANSAASRLFSRDHATLLGSMLAEFDTRISSRDPAGISLYGLAGMGSKVVGESVYRLPGGKRLPVELSVGQTRFDGDDFIVTLIRTGNKRPINTEQQQFFSKSIENFLSEFFIVSETTLQFIYVNRTARENTGYSHDEFRSMRFQNICPEIREDFFDNLSVTPEQGGADRIKLEAQFVRKNGETYPVILSIHQSSYLSFNVFVIQATDISEQVRHKKDIQAAYDIINKSKSVVFVWQLEKGLPVSFVAGNLFETFGYQPEDFLTRKLVYSDVVHPNDLPRILQDIKESAEDSGQSAVDHEPYRIITADNRERWVKASAAVQRDEQGHALFLNGIVEDISDLKRHEDELFKANKLLEKTFQSISDIVLLLDPDFRIIKINKAGRKLLNRPLDQIIGCYCHEFFPGGDSVCDLSRTALDTLSISSAEVFQKSLQKHFIVSFAPIFNDDNEVIYIVNVLRDITERKLLEERLFLSEKMATIASLAAGVAHEINTPLSAILQSIQIIDMELDMQDPDNRNLAEKFGIEPARLEQFIKDQDIDYFVQGIRQSALNAAKIITNLLNFSRPRKGDMEKADINELLDTTLELARADYDLKKKYDIINVSINKNYGDALPNIPCIPMEIEQVFLNLTKNSVQAFSMHPPDSPPTISITTFRKDQHIVIWFEDNGPGIAPEILSKIFDPFFTTKEVGVGTGLGLSLSYAVIHDKHYGDISVRSEPGRGTKFIIELPIDTDA